jgi:2-methylisocitrate lyase-like PEP mutase family enzyme
MMWRIPVIIRVRAAGEPLVEQSDQKRKAEAFRRLHRSGSPLLLPNVWDPISARLFVEAGFDALATSSGGVAWALGYPDGEVAPWREVIEATRRIARAAQAPVSADIETGYGTTPAEVGEHVGEIIAAGAVGINLEDGLRGALRDTEDAVVRLRAAREAARQADVPIVINARCDAFHVQQTLSDERLAATADRCRRYVEAGADCIYLFGLRDAATIEKLVKIIVAPINVTGRPGMPDLPTLAKIGVARITLAAAPALVAMSDVAKLAGRLRANFDYADLEGVVTRPVAQKLFADRTGE